MKIFRMSAKIPAALIGLVIFAWCESAQAHVHWTRGNGVDPDTVGLYHFDQPDVVPGGSIAAADGLSDDLDLIAVTPVGNGADFPADLAYPFFAPRCIRFNGVQSAESSGTMTGLDGDLTIECFFKWSPSFTSGTLQFGLRSGVKLLLSRNVGNPSADRFGMLLTHGDYVSATGFTNWPDVGDEEASLGQWRHLGVTIHSAGLVHDPVLDHDVYSTGSVARIYLNGHAVGTYPNTIGISGMRAHSESRLTLGCTGGSGILVDEFTVWRRDWSDNGVNTNPFSDGRGGSSAVMDWALYGEKP